MKTNRNRIIAFLLTVNMPAMKITLLVVGKTNDPHFIAGIEEYTRRIRHYLPFDMEVIPELKNTKSLSEDQQKEREADLLLKTFQTTDRIVLLDEKGREFRSTEFAEWIDKKAAGGCKRLVFVVGGPYGFSPRVYEQGNPVLWFMYTLIGLYLLAPVLSRWLNYASRTEIEFYLGLWGISLCFPIVRPVVNINTGDTGILYYFTGYAGYFVLGYYLKQYPKRIPWKALFPLLTVAMAAPVVCKTAGWKVDFYDLFWYLSVFVAIQCVSWYRMAECIEHWQIWLRMRKTLTQLSSLSFGIYLIHIFIMRYLLWQWEFIRVIDSYIVQTTIVSLLTFAGSVLASYLISFLPGAQYIIGHTHYESTRLK